MNLYAKILIGINEGKTLYVKQHNRKNRTILVSVGGNNFVYALGEYEEINMYPNAWNKELNK